MSTSNHIIELACRMYASPTNELRAAATHQLMQAVAAVQQPQEILSVGMELLQVPETTAGAQTIAVRAYGAGMLRQAVCLQRLPAESINATAMLSWLDYDAASLAPLVRHSVAHLLVACAVRRFPETWGTVLDELCPATLSGKQYLLPMLQQFCEACVEPPMGAVDLTPHRLRALRQGLRAQAPTFVPRLIAAMHVWYQNGLHAPLKQGLVILAAVSSTLSPQEWWSLGIHEVVGVLSQCAPCAKEACLCSGAMLRASDQLTVDDATAIQFAESTLRQIEPLIAQQDWETVQELIDIATDLPKPFAQKLEQTLVTFAQLVLDVPSVLFAISAADLLRSLELQARPSSEVAHIIRNPDALLRSIYNLTQKHKVHPSYAKTASTFASSDASRIQSGIMHFSQTQFPTIATFDVGFADMRGTLAHLLNVLSAHFPEVCAGYCVDLIRSLPSAPYSFDTLTRAGHVQQHSQTFSEWQAAQYMLEQLVPNAFSGAAASVATGALGALSSKTTTDAVLVPVFLNIMSSFWPSSSKWAPTLLVQLWEWSTRVMFDNMQLRSGTLADTVPSHIVPLSDPDLISARKRAHTIFVHASVHHGQTMVGIASLDLLKRCQSQLVREGTLTSEKAFLYEAVAALSNEMEASEQSAFLEAMIGPMRELILATKATDLADIICCSSQTKQMHQKLDERAMLRDSIGVLAAILRRCKPSPYMEMLVTRIIPTLGNFLLTVHSLDARQVPAQYRGIFELSPIDRDQFLTGTARKPEGPTNDDVGRARSALHQIRLSLYQALGSIGSFVALESYASSLIETVQHCAAFEIHTMRAFAENAMFRWLKSSLAMATFIFPALRAFFTAQSARQRTTSEEVVDCKQLFYFTKDVIAALTSVVDTARWHTLPGLEDEVVALVEVLTTSGFEPRGVANFVMKLIQSKSLSADVSAHRCFGTLALACASSPRYAERDRDTIAGMLSQLYANNLDGYGGALQRLGVPQELLNALNASLALAPRIDARRKAFRTFLEKASSSSSKN